MDRAYTWVRRHKIQHASPGPQLLPAWNKSAGGIRAFYSRDPDGHPLDVLWFPPDNGNPKWHVSTDKLFLGIDHTVCGSIGTGSEWTSQARPRTTGPEQERLNNVFGARLHITALGRRA